VESTDGDFQVDDFFGGQQRQALAALALHSQPFGFTWEDVDALRAVAHGLAEFVRYYGTGSGILDADTERAVREAVASGLWLVPVADRIAALLPPR
jgi:hypothetical protein